MAPTGAGIAVPGALLQALKEHRRFTMEQDIHVASHLHRSLSLEIRLPLCQHGCILELDRVPGRKTLRRPPGPMVATFLFDLPLVLSSVVDLAQQRLGRIICPVAGHMRRVLPGEAESLRSGRSSGVDGETMMIPFSAQNLARRAGPGTKKGIRALNHECTLRNSQTKPMLYLRPLGFAEPALQFHTFDTTYIENLRSGDLPTQTHFVGYFTELLHLKLRSRLQSRDAIEDVRQETFARVLTTIRKEGALRQPDRLGAFVNTVCNHVLLEHYRSSSRSQSLDEEGQPEIPFAGADALGIVMTGQLKGKVRAILLGMPDRDRALLKAVFLDEKDRDQVCREFGVDREYLRVLVFRAKQEFKTEYLKQMGAGSMKKD